MLIATASAGVIIVAIIVGACLLGTVCWFLYTAFRTTQFVERFVDPNDNAAGEDPEAPDLAVEHEDN